MMKPLDPGEPGLTLWLTVGCPTIYRHMLKHVSTSLVHNIDMLVDTHVHSSVAATRGRIPRLHARLHVGEGLRFSAAISQLNLPSTLNSPLDGLRCLSSRSMTGILSYFHDWRGKAIRVWPSNSYSKGYPRAMCERHRVTRHLSA
jgi:hypothetical protein